MSKAYYLRMAGQNLLKNKKTYIPFILTSTFTTMMLYMIISLSGNQGIMNIPGGGYMTMMLGLGVVVVELFVLIFLFYTNSFLLKRRKKEFGLYSVLGMEKKHLARVIFYELFFSFLVSIAFGLGLGILLDKLLFLLVLKMLDTQVPLGFSISVKALTQTFSYIGLVYIVMFIYGIVQVSLANPIELLRSGEVAEKEPKAKWIITLLGIVCLASGYAISISITNPITAMIFFFLAVILVIVGTYLLFVSGSISFLKMLEKNKAYYYKTNHFLSVSNMKFRMKQNGVSLGNICILSTMVLVMISTTLSLWTGLNEVVGTYVSNDYVVKVTYPDFNEQDQIAQDVQNFWNEEGFSPQSVRQCSYLKVSLGADQQDRYDHVSFDQNAVYFRFMTLDDYNTMEGTNVTLAPNEILVYSERVNLEGDQLSLLGQDYQVRPLDSFDFSNDTAQFINGYMDVILPNKEDILRIKEKVDPMIHEIYPEFSVTYTYLSGIDQADKDRSVTSELDAALGASLKNVTFERANFYSRQETFKEYKSFYAGFLFIGIFLSLLFIMAMILIMYYKQMSEGYEDQKRYEIMQNVGLDEKMIKKTINTQVITVFFLPLIVAGIHICFAFPIISKLLLLLNLTNTMFFVLVTLACFVLFSMLYVVIYWFTAKAYYKIISSREQN
ncbi:hypothetical protein C815_00343 [Firmicutes bacterium M10-2]|nr:hypothetical protein C815_00343 [Firmicutes bacterium M10-2]